MKKILLYLSMAMSTLAAGSSLARAGSEYSGPVAPAGTDTVLSAYPNPFSKTLTIEYNSNDLGISAELQIIDVVGKVCYRSKFTELQTKAGKLSIELDMINPGVYFIYFNDGQKHTTLRVIKQ